MKGPLNAMMLLLFPQKARYFLTSRAAVCACSAIVLFQSVMLAHSLSCNTYVFRSGE